MNADPDLDPDIILPNVNNIPHHNLNISFSISIQNVRSMNISTRNDITTEKILAVSAKKTDFIFLSDLRLNSNKQISAVNDLTKKFFLKGYKFYHNSILPSRGVGILIHKNIYDSNFQILESSQGIDCNYLILHVEYNSRQFILCSLYGPNHDTEIEFYDVLKRDLQRFNCPIIIGGDWNATLDDSNVNQNIDIVNMRNLPSLRRTLKILELSSGYHLVLEF